MRSRLVGAATVVLFGMLGTQATAMRRPITQADSGRTIHLARGDQMTFRLSNRWRWSEPRATTKAIELTPVEYFVNPGFREWQIEGRALGRATLRALGAPRCADCKLAARRFSVTIVVDAP